jgi:hypothetical protein
MKATCPGHNLTTRNVQNALQNVCSVANAICQQVATQLSAAPESPIQPKLMKFGWQLCHQCRPLKHNKTYAKAIHSACRFGDPFTLLNHDGRFHCKSSWIRCLVISRLVSHAGLLALPSIFGGTSTADWLFGPHLAGATSASNHDSHIYCNSSTGQDIQLLVSPAGWWSRSLPQIMTAVSTVNPLLAKTSNSWPVQQVGGAAQYCLAPAFPWPAGGGQCSNHNSHSLPLNNKSLHSLVFQHKPIVQVLSGSCLVSWFQLVCCPSLVQGPFQLLPLLSHRLFLACILVSHHSSLCVAF